MSGLRQKISGKLNLLKVPANACFTTVAELLKLIQDSYSVDLSAGVNNDFVVTGHQPPGADDKNRLWVRQQRQGSFAGFYMFIGGAWKRIFNRRNDEIIWMHGDSREIPDGFTLISESTGGLTSDVREHVMQFYLEDTSVSQASPVYKYFAVRYTGI